MKLIPQWKRAWQMLSVQVAGLAVVWGTLPTDTQAAVLSIVGVAPERVPAILGLLLIVARLIDQPRVTR